MLERVGLAGAGKRRVGDYSLGMRQRLGIGTALLGDPAVLILDEPANGMDPEGIRWMRHLLQDFAAGGGTVLLSSHLLGEVQATVDRLVVIGGGRIVADDRLDVLLAGQGTFVRGLDPRRSPPRCAVPGSQRRPRRRRPARRRDRRSRSAASPPPRGQVLVELRDGGAGLEDLFFTLTERRGGGGMSEPTPALDHDATTRRPPTTRGPPP